MNDIATTPAEGRSATAASPREGRLGIYALGMSLGLFLAITFVLCVAFDLLFPQFAMHPAWEALLPGFAWLTLPSFLLGLVETFLYGWYVALIVGPLYNYFSTGRA